MTMLNINEGHNKELMEQCQILKEYSLYVTRVQKYAVQMELSKEFGEAEYPLTANRGSGRG